MPAFTIWRHPRPRGAAGRCIGGRTDLPVDPRKAKRLAHRIRAHARRHGLPREVVTSPLARAADVGRWLRRWGFLWRVDATLAEMDFGAWEGRPGADIPREDFDAWTADFADLRAGVHGESVRAFMLRVAQAHDEWLAQERDVLWVTHAGVLRAVTLLQRGIRCPATAGDWPSGEMPFGGWLVFDNPSLT